MVEATQESTQEPQSATEQPETWETPEYEAALAKLERLQEQLDQLRSTIPSIVAPLARSSSGKAQVAANMRKAAIQSTDDLKHFREQWTSAETRDVFTKSQTSAQKDGDLGKAVDVARYGWS